MKILKPTYEIVEQQYDDLITDMFKHIERCGRICYKSDDKITEDSYIKFAERLEKSNHGAMLEHGTVYLTVPIGSPLGDYEYELKSDIVLFFMRNEYSVVNKKNIEKSCDLNIDGYDLKTQASVIVYFITTNWRVIYENKDVNIVKDFYNNYKADKTTLEESIIKWITKPTINHEKRYTVIFTCDIGVSREFNRHRKDSIAEESTRYCNYSKGKFGGELNFVEPVFLSDDEKNILNNYNDHLSLQEMCVQIGNGTNYASFEAIDYFIFALEACEFSYLHLIKLGWTPQQARFVLPLNTKTTLVHTAFAKDWIHFFDLRAIGTTGQPHPSAKELALPLMQEFIKRKYIQ